MNEPIRRRLQPGGSLTPAANAKRAYSAGYQAALQGDDRNPYLHLSRRVGLALSAWWSTGYSDGRHGLEQRYGGGGEA